MQTLRAEIFKRFMSPEDYDTLLANYRANKKTRLFVSRHETLSQPIVEQDKQMLQDYLTTDLTLKQLGEKYQINPATLYNKVVKAALKLQFQKGA